MDSSSKGITYNWTCQKETSDPGGENSGRITEEVAEKEKEKEEERRKREEEEKQGEEEEEEKEEVKEVPP